MRILMVSMNSIHFRRWTSQLEGSGHEVFWFDILGAEGNISSMSWMQQKTDWRLKIKKGRYLFKKIPLLKKLNENKLAAAFEKYLIEIQPDLVHSFVLYMSCAPILSVMQKHKGVKWLYSAWGNDLYYYQNFPTYKKEIDEVLPHLDYMFADCQRDIDLAKRLGFSGKSLGVFPGGGGYHLDLIQESIKAVKDRKYIIMKGYQGEKHRALNILKAIEQMENHPEVIIFSADTRVVDYCKVSTVLKNRKIKIYTKNDHISHQELCRLMNRSLIYIGNNKSDGMPNTLLEAICFGAFPIQSNPGGASAEIIEDGINGLLIQDCENIQEIQQKIEKVLEEKSLVNSAFKYNMELRKQLEYEVVRKNVLKAHINVEQEIKA